MRSLSGYPLDYTRRQKTWLVRSKSYQGPNLVLVGHDSPGSLSHIAPLVSFTVFVYLHMQGDLLSSRTEERIHGLQKLYDY